MTLDIDPDQVDLTARQLERQRRYVEEAVVTINQVGFTMNVWGITLPAATLAGELTQELGLMADVLRTRVELATAADNGWTLRAYEHAEQVFTAQLGDLTASTGDDVGATGSDEDARAHLARVVLGPGEVPTNPAWQVPDTARWEAEHVVGPVLDAATPEQAAEYWSLLGTDGQDLAIDLTTPEVSDRFIAGDIDLDEYQVISLRGQPLPAIGRTPSTGPDTDWAGTPIAEEHVVWAYDAELEPIANDLVCSVIQFGSPIPSPQSTDPVEGTIDGLSTANTIRQLAQDGALLIPSTTARSVPLVSIFTGLVDLGLCRLGVGSGYPISTDQVVNEEGEVVYEGSNSHNKYMDANGVTLSPDPRERDRQMWNAEYNVDNGNWKPYPGFPAFEVNAQGYDPAD